ncbi:MAG TPA: sulfotransferase, partial [Anaerolineae bacterium]|nr:sulfotransferase [Anaerolineae bacterium]
LISNPSQVLHRVADFLQTDFEKSFGHFAQHLPQVNIVSRPDLEKWQRRNPEAIERILPLIDPMMQRLGYDSSS